MGLTVAEEFSIRDLGALGVFANYMHSTDAVPRLKPDTSKMGKLINQTMTPTLSPTRPKRSPSRPSTPNMELYPVPSDVSSAKMLSSVITTTKVPNFDIGFKMIGDLTGKDKIAKIALYSMRIILIYAERFSKMSPRDLNQNDKKINIVLKFLKSPRILIAVLSKLYLHKSFEVINALSLYRQLLRFGKNPFRLRNLIVSLKDDLYIAQKLGLTKGLLLIYSNWFNEDKFQEIINFYYGLTDEILVLYKLKVLTSPNLRKWAGNHECYSWYLDIILGLKQNFIKLRKLNEKEASITLNHEVRVRARQMIKNLKLDNASSPVRNSLTTSQLDKELLIISKEKQIIKLSILGLLCDFCFDTIDVFNLKVKRTLYLSFGLMSAYCGLTKLYIKFRDELQQ